MSTHSKSEYENTSPFEVPPEDIIRIGLFKQVDSFMAEVEALDTAMTEVRGRLSVALDELHLIARQVAETLATAQRILKPVAPDTAQSLEHDPQSLDFNLLRTKRDELDHSKPKSKDIREAIDMVLGLENVLPLLNQRLQAYQKITDELTALEKKVDPLGDQYKNLLLQAWAEQKKIGQTVPEGWAGLPVLPIQLVDHLERRVKRIISDGKPKSLMAQLSYVTSRDDIYDALEEPTTEEI